MFQIKQGGLSSLAISGTGQTKVKAKRMVEQVLNPWNIMRAYRKVVSNNGSAGIDGMPVKELYAYLTKNREQIESDIHKGRYLPQPIRGMKILKKNGKERLLLSLIHI